MVPFFRSPHQARLLATILLQPDREHTITELAARIGAPISTVHGEIGRLINAGVVRERRVGRARLLSTNKASRLVKPLTDLLLVTYGPLAVVAEEFGTLEHVDLVLIYGSWAARYRGEPGPPPNDVDLLVVGAPARTDVYDAAERAQRRLGIPVNPVVSSWRRWTEAPDALIQQIKASPFEPVIDRHLAQVDDAR
jgi:DNA-binding transcriptional ArsR family regulator